MDNGYIKSGLESPYPLKVIMRGSIQKSEGQNICVVSIVFATMNKELAEQRIHKLIRESTDPKMYYMVYSVPFDTDLTALEHYPSIAVFPSDLMD